jgi:O-antigen ligase
MTTAAARRPTPPFNQQLVPLLLFVLSAAVGVWVAYNRAAAIAELALVVVGLAVYAGFALCPERVRVPERGEMPLLAWVLGSLPTLVVLYFFLTNDWAARLGKVAWLDPLLRGAQRAAWQSSLVGVGVNSNVIGGVIAMLLPMQVAALFQNRRVNGVALALMAVSLVGLVLSESRGAWLAVSMVALGWGLWRLLLDQARRRGISPRTAHIVWAISLAVILLMVALGLILTPFGERLLHLRSDRLQVWRNSFDLATDYAFTGLGLAGFDMAYSSYVLLVHVSHTIHAHNLYLNIWLNQGLVGLVAFGGWLIAAVWTGVSASPNASSRWRVAALASLGVLLLHGLVDDAFYGYGGRGVVLMFVPLAMLARSSVPIPGIRFQPATVYLGFAGIFLIAAALVPAAQSAWQANLGAVLQTQTELSVYQWPQWPIQDAVRRSAQINLAPAIEHYQAALRLNPANAAANRRMGQIELSRGHDDPARRYLQAAFRSAPRQRATRQLLGEVYALAGQPQPAAALWKTIDVSLGQLPARVWWYDHIGDQSGVANLNRAIEALK